MALKLTFGKVTPDETDRKLLEILLADSRQSYRRIASKAGVSVATVMNRINRLEKEGIIRGYTATLDYEKLGYDIDAIINMKISKGKLFEIENKIAHHPSVAAVYDVTGDFDSTIVAKFKNRRALDAFLKKIQTYEFVERTSTVLILNTIKSSQIKP
ncbi:Lrp/AsnC family transcriptional regulator [Candidatus Woesearchaeota archaeon]|nr:Lrp/AsnC family transcriptional regulator [Candidatus Woesearchaeota archaeon]